MFWVANSISSTLLGWNNRRLQDKAHERNQEFQLEMERARRITDDERMQEDIAFKRRLVALAREQRQEVSRQSFNAQMQAALGLDQPLPIQYLNWLGKTLQGNLGRSYIGNLDIAPELLTRLPITLKLSLSALAATMPFVRRWGYRGHALVQKWS